MFVTVPKDAVFHVVNGNDLLPVGHPDLPAEPGEPVRLTFARDFVRRTLLNDQAFGADAESVTMGAELRGYFDGKGPGDVVEIPKGHLDKLCAVMRKPANGYNPPVAGQMHGAGFFRALEKASETKEVS